MTRVPALSLAALALFGCAGLPSLNAPQLPEIHGPAVTRESAGVNGASGANGASGVSEPRGAPAVKVAAAEVPVIEAPAPGPEEAPPVTPAPARLPRSGARMALPAGRSVVAIELPTESSAFVSIGVLGPAYALLSFDIVAPPVVRAIAAHGALDEDGILPRIVSFRAPAGVDAVTVVVDASEPVEIARISAPPPPRPPSEPAAPLAPLAPGASRKPQAAVAVPMALVGLPAPLARDDGYLLQSPGRYLFIRLDVASSLLAALRQTRVRFRRDPIAIGDISQWDGLRPATDLGKPRHISHQGGRDIDIGLPASDGEPSTLRAHCEGVLVERDVQGCAPGTVRGFDALRTAYLLGLLFEGPPPLRIERVFTDDAYIREIRRAAEVLRERRWIKAQSFEGLFDDQIVRPSPWHVDHMHVRFAGAPGQVLW